MKPFDALSLSCDASKSGEPADLSAWALDVRLGIAASSLRFSTP